MQSLRGALSLCRWPLPVCPSPAVSSIKTPDAATSSLWLPTFSADSTRRVTTLCWSQVWQASLLIYWYCDIWASHKAALAYSGHLHTAGGWQQQITFQHHVQNLQKFYRMLLDNGFPKDHIKTFFSNGQISGMTLALYEHELPIMRTYKANLGWFNWQISTKTNIKSKSQVSLTKWSRCNGMKTCQPSFSLPQTTSMECIQPQRKQWFVITSRTSAGSGTVPIRWSFT